MRLVFALYFAGAFLWGCTAKDESASREMTVLAAASLKESFEEISKQFEKAENVHVNMSFGASSMLARQIAEGAKADVFASADSSSMDVSKLPNPQPFAGNKLAIVTSKKMSMKDLTKPGTKIVLAAPSVPAGKYALKFLDKQAPSFRKAFLNNVVSHEENVRAVLAKVTLGEADAGIVYETDARTAANIHVIAIPEEQNVAAVYMIASSTPDGEKFMQYVLSRDGQTTLRNRGFSAPK